jgi:hypothetical protein
MEVEVLTVETEQERTVLCSSVQTGTDDAEVEDVRIAGSSDWSGGTPYKPVMGGHVVVA